ncbi:hypothetical protein N656DRAFT_774240 [Canariomyces notabilis]|uniref:Uncharacterized protein n=1 Tax=Canariomyces notabilis TaxID=2074819 RepID=A0AAN6YX11_9PEZI|nr:hypothetical protein N656DRAFT_774240 [Canariomyces arenarius]
MARLNEGIQMAWRIFGLEYTTTTQNTPGLTRKGFRDLMVRNAIMYPPGQARAYDMLLAKHRARLVALGAMLPAGEIAMECFMPAGIPATGDGETQRVYREQQANWVWEYKARFTIAHMGCLAGGAREPAGGWGLAMQLENFKHNMTMDALGPGYREPNGSVGIPFTIRVD